MRVFMLKKNDPEAINTFFLKTAVSAINNNTCGKMGINIMRISCNQYVI